jgi:hypothetical protein
VKYSSSEYAKPFTENIGHKLKILRTDIVK